MRTPEAISTANPKARKPWMPVSVMVTHWMPLPKPPGKDGAMLKVMYADSELLTLGYAGKVNAVVGEALFDGLFEGTIDYLNGEVRSYAGDGHSIYISEKCHMNGEFAGLVKFKKYDRELDVPELAKTTLEHLEQQNKRG